MTPLNQHQEKALRRLARCEAGGKLVYRGNFTRKLSHSSEELYWGTADALVDEQLVRWAATDMSGTRLRLTDKGRKRAGLT